MSPCLGWGRGEKEGKGRRGRTKRKGEKKLRVPSTGREMEGGKQLTWKEREWRENEGLFGEGKDLGREEGKN